jgi:hypothetical protein
MWQRWNGTSHVFEKSDDNGSSWAPLPLSALTITEGTLPAARLPSTVAMRDASNMFTAGPQILNPSVVGTAYHHLRVNGVTYGALGASGALRGNAETDLMVFAETGKSFIITVDGNPTIEALRVQPGGVITTRGQAFIMDNVINGYSYLSVRNTNNTAGSYAMLTLNASGNSWGWRMHSLAGNVNTLDLVIDALGSPVVRMSMYTNGHLCPGSDNSGSVGNSSLRWGLVRAVTITPGDLTFDNGWTVTEGEKVGLGPGLAFLDADENIIAFVGPEGFKDVSELSYKKSSKAERRDMKPINHASLLEAHIGE